MLICSGVYRPLLGVDNLKIKVLSVARLVLLLLFDG
ncbi:hypothetical protein PBOIBFNE_02687 [Escherichia coli]|nr:hypothetical protein G683_00055 [Escherichia coli HVH 3 (4-7276001)]GDD44838.1 hypothetical protein HmCmsJML225_03239 [Escherichia coli]GDK69250.1 hypothetical protein BvCmsKSP027_04643 [Escherichia coli]GDL55678.1 hypothetical protein BvCmsKSP003_04068 [Escherichia coli]